MLKYKYYYGLPCFCFCYNLNSIKIIHTTEKKPAKPCLKNCFVFSDFFKDIIMMKCLISFMTYVLNLLPINCLISVAFWAGCFSKAGDSSPRTTWVCVCSCTHIGWQNCCSRICHCPFCQAHDKVSLHFNAYARTGWWD